MGFVRQLRPRARIACLTGDEAREAALTKHFATVGYDIVSHKDADGADIGLVDLRGRNITAKQTRRIAAMLRRRSPEASLLFLIDPALAGQGRAHLRRAGEIIPTEDDLSAVLTRVRQVLRMRNLADEAGERLKSLAALTRLGEFPTIAPKGGAARILLAGPPSAAALASAAAMDRAGALWSAVFSTGQSLRAIETERFDGAIFLPNEQNDLLQSLGRSIQRNPKFAHFPIIHIGHSCDDLAAFAGAGARDFMLADHIADDLPQKILTSVRRARLAETLRGFLNACSGDGVRDPASGAFAGAFLSQHGARLAARADAADRPMCLAAFKLHGDKVNAKVIDRTILTHAAGLIRRITRADDTLARISADSFALMMPATVEDDADLVGARIEGVLGNTLFRRTDEDLASVKVAWSAVTRENGQCIEETVAAALAGLAPAQPDRVSG
ncbi:MAG: hypothetical protein AAGC95_15940 [Pseudomonadota bacterium]